MIIFFIAGLREVSTKKTLVYLRSVQFTQGTMQTIYQHISEMEVLTHNSNLVLFTGVGSITHSTTDIRLLRAGERLWFQGKGRMSVSLARQESQDKLFSWLWKPRFRSFSIEEEVIMLTFPPLNLRIAEK